MRAVILAGGKGTRLRPFTTLIPKPLVPIGENYSIVEVIILQLKRSGFSHITLCVNHCAHLLQAYLGDGSKYGLKLDYSIEEMELSTIGPLTIIPDLPEQFLVMNGDVLTDLDYATFLESHIQANRNFSIAAYRRDQKIDFGVLSHDPYLKLNGFVEKPIKSFLVSMGVYAVDKSIVDRIPKNSRFGFDDLMLDMLKRQEDVVIDEWKGFWLDIGRPDDYDYANTNRGAVLRALGIEDE